MCKEERNIFEELNDIRNEKGELTDEINDIQDAFKVKINQLMVEMNEATQSELNRMSALSEREGAIKSNLVTDWPYDELTHIDDSTGIKIQKRKSDTPEVKDLKTLLMTVLSFEELPIKKVNFDNRKLITLAEAGVISKDQVEIHTTHNVAITFPKEKKGGK